jgi:diketogulonate reductase-like aldo/keto reductase
MSTEHATGTGLRRVTLPGGEEIPVLGVGTWGIAERPGQRLDEIAALQMAVDLGMTVIDTAEMYAGGAAEELVAEALGDRRREIFLVGKVLPQHATRRGTVSACEASLRRLNTDHLDLYLLHWRGTVPLDETLAAFDALERQGKIRHWGVSNFDADDMEELVSLTANADSIVASNQVLYNLARRGIEYDLLPWCRKRRISVMAYSPLEQGRLAKEATVKAIAKRLDATPAQVALAWVLRQQGVVAIPKAAHFEHVREDRGALDIELSSEDIDELDEAFPPPTRKTPLEMI